MDIKKVGILEKNNFSTYAIEQLKKHYDVSFFNSEDDIRLFIEDKYAIFIRLAYKIDDDIIKNAMGLKYICSPTTGLNHISISSPNVEVVSLKGEYEFLSTIRATPEHVFGLTISLLRNYKRAFRSIYNDVWDRDLYRGEELYNNCVGIIGFGRIGKILSSYFNSFGANVYVYEVNKEHYLDYENSNSVRFVDTIDELIGLSSIVILCVNYEPKNEKMISKEHFCMMRGKYFINASRGELVDEYALMDFISENEFKGIAIDVFSNETGDMELYRRVLEISADKNIIITPHIGGATYTSMHRTEEFIVEKLLKIEKIW